MVLISNVFLPAWLSSSYALTNVRQGFLVTMKERFIAAAADEELLRHNLAEADALISLLVLTHITRDTSILDEVAPYIGCEWQYSVSIPEKMQAKIRDRLAEVVIGVARSDDGVDASLPADLLKHMLNVGAGGSIPSEYIPLMIEELQFDGGAGRTLQWRQSVDADRTENCEVVIVGAGLSGLCAAKRLQEAGIPFEIFEKNDQIGGTWYENRYPDCAVDTPNHLYSYSFDPNPNWSRYFSKQPEILEYIRSVARKFDLEKHIRFNSEVDELTWDECSSRWIVRGRDCDGSAFTRTCRAVISSVGILNRPSLPHIKGLEDFEGQHFHTAQWPKDLDLAGKRVAMIGTGASGVQAGPAIAPIVESLSIFQRSTHWVMHSPLYHAEVSQGQRWVLANIPYFAEWQRFVLFWASSDLFHAMLKVDPEWTLPDVSLNAANHQIRLKLIENIRRELEGREDLIAKCIPSYPPYGKRMLRDNHWFRTLRRPNVELVTEGISHVDRHGIVTTDGARHEADVIVLATGFHAGKMLWPMTVRGRGGRVLSEQWGGDNPEAYLGIAVPNFPNLFLTLGPNTNLAHGGSLVFHIECQVKYIMQALRELIESDSASLEVRKDIHDRYNADLTKICSGMVWAHPGVENWYKNADNKVTITSPYRLVDYWSLTHSFNPSEYIAKPWSDSATKPPHV